MAGEVDTIGIGSATHLLGVDSNTAGEMRRIPFVYNNVSGNFGLGVSVPLDKLHIVGSMRFDIGSARAIAQRAATAHQAGNVGSLTLGIADGAGVSGVSIINTHNGTYSSQEISFSTAEGGVSATTERMKIAKNGNILAGADNSQSLGSASFRWSVVYAGTGTINTSDAREKTKRNGKAIGKDFKVSPLDAAELSAARAMAAEIGVYKWKDSVAEKGDGARFHIGLTVQRVVQIMEENGLDPWLYGFMCKDEITRRVKSVQIVTEQKTAPDPEFDLVIEIINGIPTQVKKARPDRLVFEMKPVVDADGKPVPLMYPVPVMVQIEREEWIDEPAGERLGFRPDQLALFIMAGVVNNG